MNSNNYRYTNMLSSYGFGDNTTVETYPEERRNWRKAIKEHVDDAMGITDEQIENGENMTKRLESARDNIKTHVTVEDNRIKGELTNTINNAKTSVETTVNSAKSSIETTVNNAKTEINNRIGELGNPPKTVIKRLEEIKGEVDTILSWTNTHYWWNGN